MKHLIIKRVILQKLKIENYKICSFVYVGGVFSCTLNKLPIHMNSKRFVLKFENDCSSLGDFSIYVNLGLTDNILEDFFNFSHLSQDSNIKLTKNNSTLTYSSRVSKPIYTSSMTYRGLGRYRITIEEETTGITGGFLIFI